MIDKSKFVNAEFLERALALPFSEVLRHASVESDNVQGKVKRNTESFTGTCYALISDAAVRLRAKEADIEYYVRARRWNDRNGNTYHSVLISDANQEDIAFIPFAYGYESHYKQTAFDWFRKAGLVPDEFADGSYAPAFRAMRVDCEAVDVKTKRELTPVVGVDSSIVVVKE